MKSVWIIGQGQLGTDLHKLFTFKGYDVISTTSEQYEVTRSRLPDIIPYDVVIYCAAYHDLTKCEEHPEKAFEVNAFGVRRVVQQMGTETQFVYLSTNYCKDPVNAYTYSKLAGEQYAKEHPNTIIARVANLYGTTPPSGKPDNFVDLIVKKIRDGETISGKGDELCNPTFTLDAAVEIDRLIREESKGTFDVVNYGCATIYEWIKEITKLVNPEYSLIRAYDTDEDDRPRRPKEAVTEVSNLPKWQDGLKRYLEFKGEIQ